MSALYVEVPGGSWYLVQVSINLLGGGDVGVEVLEVFWEELWLHFFWPTFWLHCILYLTYRGGFAPHVSTVQNTQAHSEFLTTSISKQKPYVLLIFQKIKSD